VRITETALFFVALYTVFLGSFLIATAVGR
jgi:hypothetical protein